MESLIHWLGNVTLEDIKSVLISIPGVVLAWFSIYFAYQKIGNKVLVSYTVGFSRTTEGRISEVELINEKNKPISIFSIHAVLNKDVVVELDSFEVPVILKPLESIHLITPEFSALYLGDERYEADYNSPNEVEIFLVTHNKKIKCKRISPPSINKMFDFEHLRKTIKSRQSFNGKVFNDNVKYAITYRFNSNEYTALVEDWGFICEEWGFKYNRIPDEYMSSKEKVKEYLSFLGYDKFFDALHVDDVNKLR